MLPLRNCLNVEGVQESTVQNIVSHPLYLSGGGGEGGGIGI